MLIILPHEANRQPTLEAHAHEENIISDNSFSYFNELNQNKHIIRRILGNSFFTRLQH